MRPPAIAGCLLIGAAVACGDGASRSADPAEAGPAPPSATEPLPGTARAIADLADIYQTALQDPMRYGHLNRRRAEVLREEVAGAAGADQVLARLRYAMEELSAGRTDVAIREFERLVTETGSVDRVLASGGKEVIESLAVAYLRLGESRNRAHDPADASILPFTANAVYTDGAPVRRAIALYRRILRRYPRDLQSRWLLNIAYLTLGEYPGDVPDGLLIEGLAADSGVSYPRFRNVAPALGVDMDGIAGGLSIEDFNEDGLLDILATARGLSDSLRLFLADGSGGFVDRTAAAGLAGLVGGLNTAHADYDNDGYDDVMIVRGGWLGAYGQHPNSLLRNRGDGTFEDVAAAAGLASRYPTQTAAWGDFNNDGWIDLFIGNEGGRNGGGSGRCELYANNGDGTFSEVAAQVGIDVFEFVKAVAWGDVDNDGLIDLYLSIFDQPNRLYRNLGGSSPGHWRFEEVGAAAGVQQPVASFPVFFWDFDNDGWQDLFVASFDVARSSVAAGEVAARYLGLRSNAERNRVYHNNGDGTFTDVAPALGLDQSLWAMGINVGDVNNDGFPDVYVGTGTPDLRSIMPNRMFLNERGSAFRDVTFDVGVGHLQKGHAIGFADFDRDGDQDVYAVMGGAVEGEHYPNALFENPGFGSDNTWVVLDLVGRTANRSAVGARIRLRVTDRSGSRRTIHATVSTGGSFGASSLQQEVGLGPAGRIDELTISWPNAARTTDVYTDLAVNTYYRVVEGQEPVPLERPPTPFRAQGGSNR